MAHRTRLYSREFPRGAERCTIAADWAPPALKRQAQAKARRERVSLRTVILRQLTAYVNAKDATP